MENLIQKIRAYNPLADVKLIRRAYNLACEAHKGQKRISGERQIEHLLGTAHLLADIKLDDCAIAAGLLHDILKDTYFNRRILQKQIRPEVSRLVILVSRLKSISTRVMAGVYRENLRRLILTVAQDIRPVLVRLAEKIHDLQTLEAFEPSRRMEILSKIFDVYAPLAGQIGAYHYKRLLEDGAFRYMHPKSYQNVKSAVGELLLSVGDWLDKFPSVVYKELDKNSISAEVYGRTKHLYSVYQKYLQKRKAGESETEFVKRCWDIIAFRVIVNKESDCYKALSCLEAVWPRGPKFKDYIAHPKPNGYRSINTTIIGPNQVPVEIQIRTRKMHEYNEYGPAAHSFYKELGREKGGRIAAPPERIRWLRSLLKWHSNLLQKGSPNFEINSPWDRVFVLTPKGDVFDLPLGATPVDFAYRVHSRLGNSCRGALVEGKIVPLSYQLKSGQVCKILADKKKSTPSLDWLKFVKTRYARQKIRRALGLTVRRGA
ncbi:hypothetical protein B5M47_02255 [candidate division CPR3 bacterium 4484_211]|uniref:TGS domain-containing protein n=1 Tax=candidate division CPR3 bacterium 4484_211 TaxID=1968527 RepID=A0A1W9NXY5_UNCC3|nr:MAG: hypothetical protein B5M47_02255 [candidate division CPR3 bacterium 4484_211]